jgi:hypothetical protein
VDNGTIWGHGGYLGPDFPRICHRPLPSTVYSLHKTFGPFRQMVKLHLGEHRVRGAITLPCPGRSHHWRTGIVWELVADTAVGSRNDWSARCEPYPPEQSKELGQVRDIVLLVTQRVPVEARGLIDEFNIERLPLGFDRFVLRETKL